MAGIIATPDLRPRTSDLRLRTSDLELQTSDLGAWALELELDGPMADQFENPQLNF